MCSSPAPVLGVLALAIAATGAAAHGVEPAPIEKAVVGAQSEARAFAAEVARRAEDYSQEARALAEAAAAHMNDAAAPGDSAPADIAKLLTGAPQIASAAAGERPAAGVIVLASFAMPEDSLRALVLDARRAGAPVVIRGFSGGSLRETANRMRALVGGSEPGAGRPPEDLFGGVVIDPRVFRIFGAEQVPVFIATAESLPDCDGLRCAAPAPAHDRIAGNMSLRAALEALSEQGNVGAAHARAALHRLERAP